MDIEQRPNYYVVFVETKFVSWQEVMQKASQEVSMHISRSKELHKAGKLLMAGTFLDRPDEPVATMAVLLSYEDAEGYIKNDPFVLGGFVSTWYIREWANMFFEGSRSK